jgi:hypothetical protein
MCCSIWKETIMKDQPIHRDERTSTVENASYRWAYLTLSFGLLMVVAYRATVLNDASWDLMALVIVGGLVATAYQGVYRIFTRRWAYVAAGTLIASAVVAALVMLARGLLQR